MAINYKGQNVSVELIFLIAEVNLQRLKKRKKTLSVPKFTELIAKSLKKKGSLTYNDLL